ncbi:MAG: hypothetical protein A2W85_12305 [Bacteroidetes bacterium GWF2_41_31]|nr:MAG: hypothetical protein A2W85_12305 [Bacteroidetes bacterium GWF2_41_31]
MVKIACKLLALVASIVCGQVAFSQSGINDSLVTLLSSRSGPEKALLFNQLADGLTKTNPRQAILWSDSSLNLLSKFEWSKERIHAFSNKAYGYFNLKNYDSSLIMMKEGLNYAKQFKEWKSEATMQGQMGMFFLQKGEFDSSLVYNIKSIALLKKVYESAEDTSQLHLMNISKALGNTGQIFIRKGDYEMGFHYFVDALKYRELAKAPPESMAKLTTNIAGLYAYLKDYENSQKYYLQTLLLYEKINDRAMMEIVYGNLGIVEKNLGNNDKAIHYYTLALKLDEELGNEEQKVNNLCNLAKLYLDEGDLDRATLSYHQALALEKMISSKFTLAELHLNMGLIYLKSNQNQLAGKHLLKSLGVAETEGMNTLIYKIEEALSQVYNNTGNYKQAYYYHVSYHNLYDSINNENSRNRLSELQTRFETEKKEKEILSLTAEKTEQKLAIIEQKSNLTRQRMIIFTILLVLFLSAGLAYFLFIRYRLKQKNKHIELENQNLQIESRLLRSQINPHFIFNALNSIQHFVLNNEKTQASTYLIKFANLMRNVLSMSRKEMVSLEDDLETLKINLELEKLRLKDKFDFVFSIDQSIELDAIYIPPMLMQPHIENAIKHGVEKKEGAGTIRIEISLLDHHLKCVIQDDGIGREKSAEKQKKGHVSVAGKLTEERFEILKKKRGTHISQEIIDLKDNHGNFIGTRVELIIPFEKDQA